MNTLEIYTKIKAAMVDAGHPVSEGDEWTAEDAVHFRNYCHFNLGTPSHIADEILKFPGAFESRIGHLIGMPSAAPVAEQEAAEQDVPVAEQEAEQEAADELAEEQPVAEEPAPVVEEQPQEEQPADEATEEQSEEESEKE